MARCETGRIHSVQSLGCADGPGLRSVVFMQGCPLRCAYCHNPDTWDAKGGEEILANALAEKLLRFAAYWKNGGVTVSGGEPLLQPGFVTELFGILKARGVHTALDTAGSMMDADTHALLDVTDLVILDYKMTNERDYLRYARCELSRINRFLALLQEKQTPTWLRQVIVSGVNDHEENLRALAKIAAQHTCIKKVELLPFQKLCAEKYEELGILFPLGDVPETPEHTVRQMQAHLTQYILEEKQA